MKTIDKISFKAILVLEHSMSAKKEELGNFEQTMELIKNDEGCHFIEWDIPEAEETVGIGIELDEGTKNVVGYDGVFELPEQAIELLKKNGFNTDNL